MLRSLCSLVVRCVGIEKKTKKRVRRSDGDVVQLHECAIALVACSRVCRRNRGVGNYIFNAQAIDYH